jgi:NAD(P)-dependent dehydrogenase (short-subunit alcohol dehydrogenase family)
VDRLRGKVAIVTGGSSGIGRATARLFAAEGALVAIGDVNEAGGQETIAAIGAAGGQALFVRTDVAQAADCERLVNAAVDRWGALHVLFNNAYWSQGQRTVVTLAEDEWDRTIGVSLKSMYLMSHFAIPAMLAAGGGSIVNMASAVALMGTQRNPAYAAAKGGVISLTKAIAIDFGKQGVRANCIAPGSIATGANVERRQDPAWADYTLERMLSPRTGQPDDIAYAALYLASDESTFLLGSTIVVDGGQTSTPNWGRPPERRTVNE